MAKPCLRWINPYNRPEVHALHAEQTFIGRGTDADIVLNLTHVSRKHAKVVRSDQGYWLVDLRSSHGTYVNGEKIERQLLRDGDRVRLGEEKMELVFRSDHSDSAAAEETWTGSEVERSLESLASIFPSRAGISELEKISCLLDFHYFWEKSFSAERTFQHILKSALEISGAERGFVLVKRAEGFHYEVGLDRQGAILWQNEFRTSQSVVQKVAQTGKAVFMTEGIEGEFAQKESIVAMKLRAVACLPLVAILSHSDTPELVGILYLDSTRKMHSLSGLDERILSKLAEEAGNVIEKLEMIKGFEERRKFEQELAMAEETQRNLLPRALPELENFQIYPYNQPTRYVGGDFYDFIQLPAAGELAGVLADVSGKGISAALLSSLLQGALNMEFRFTPQPEVVLNRVNRFLCEKTQPGRFATVFLFVLNTRGEGKYISAGHNPAFLYRAQTGEIEELASGGLILGAFDFATYQPSPFQLRLGDVLVVYSDGLTEAQNPEGELFGEDRLLELIRREAPQGSKLLERKCLDAIHDFTRGHSQTDDITFLLVEKYR